MADFRKIKTRYVRDKLKVLEYNKTNANYITDLMFIERVLSGEKINYIAGMVFESNKKKYKIEFKEIYKELDHRGYEKYLEDIDKKKKQLEESKKQRAKQEKFEEKLSRDSWKEVSENSNCT